ncbi:unnamed protein product, partial [Brenthis ino]
MIRTAGIDGIKEFGIPALDPMNVTNVSVHIMEGVSITATQASAKGMTNCVFNSFNVDWEKERAFLNVTCDALSFKGQFVVSGENSDIQRIIGSNTLNGQGRAKVKLDNTNLNIEYPMYMRKKDGEIYLMISNKNMKFTYDIGKAHFITENIIIGNTDLSQIVSSYLNDNWRTLIKEFGPVVAAKALELFVGLIANISEDTLSKCSIEDKICMKGVFQHIIQIVGSTGVQESGIPALEPLVIDKMSLNIIKGLAITVEGSVKGITNCVFNSFNINWEKERALMNVTCDALSLKGQFAISGESPEIQSIIGSNTINGQGRAKIKVDNANLNVEYSMYATKKDGEIYLKVSNKNIKYTYDIGKLHFRTEKIIIANTDLSQIISSYLNDNWRVIMKQFGPIIMDKVLELFLDLIANICDKLPANKYIIEDLHSYLKN